MGATAIPDKVTMVLENESGEVREEITLYVKSPFSSPSEILEFYAETAEGNARFQMDRYQMANFISLLASALGEAVL